MATIQWDPADQLGFSTDLQAQGILEFLYRVDSGAVINNVQNQSSVTFEFCLEGGVCMSRTQTFIGQVIPAEVFTWAFTGFTNYAAFWTALQNGTLVDYVRLTLVGTNDQDLIIDQIVANAAVPEPSTMLLIGPGLLGVAWLRRRRKV
ncbi:MAG: PEP-CTERM sorting domain-containing protein [Bryobacteraceae bacterium]